MIFIWRRWGIVAVPLFVAALLLTQTAVDALWGPGAYTANYWAKACATALGALLVGLVGHLMNRRHSSWDEKHSFFFLPLEYFAAALLLITACVSVAHVLGTA